MTKRQAALAAKYRAKMASIFADGEEDRLRNASLLQCPYKPLTKEQQFWIAGWGNMDQNLRTLAIGGPAPIVLNQ